MLFRLLGLIVEPHEVTEEASPLPAGGAEGDFGGIRRSNALKRDLGRHGFLSFGVEPRLGTAKPAVVRGHDYHIDWIAPNGATHSTPKLPFDWKRLTDEEKQQAKDFFAKIKIYQKEYEDKAKAGQLDKDFQEKVNLQVKLQQAQYLARLYSEKRTETDKVTDHEINKYIAEHPELDPAQKKIELELAS